MSEIKNQLETAFDELISQSNFEEGDIVIGQFGYINKNNRFTDAINLIKAVKNQLRLEAASDESVG